MTDISEAVTGSATPRDLLLRAGVAGLRARAGYIAPVEHHDRRDGSYLITSSGKVWFYPDECEVIRLSPEFWIEVVMATGDYDDRKLCYPNVIVFPDFVVFCWSDAMEISYEWCQLEVTRECLIELWESKTP